MRLRDAEPLNREEGRSPYVERVSTRSDGEWCSPPAARLARDTFFDKPGDFSSARRLLTNAALGPQR